MWITQTQSFDTAFLMSSVLPSIQPYIYLFFFFNCSVWYRTASNLWHPSRHDLHAWPPFTSLPSSSRTESTQCYFYLPELYIKIFRITSVVEQWWRTPLTLWRQKQVYPCKFKASVVYPVSSRTPKAPQIHRETLFQKPKPPYQPNKSHL